MKENKNNEEINIRDKFDALEFSSSSEIPESIHKASYKEFRRRTNPEKEAYKEISTNVGLLKTKDIAVKENEEENKQQKEFEEMERLFAKKREVPVFSETEFVAYLDSKVESFIKLFFMKISINGGKTTLIGKEFSYLGFLDIFLEIIALKEDPRFDMEDFGFANQIIYQQRADSFTLFKKRKNFDKAEGALKEGSAFVFLNRLLSEYSFYGENKLRSYFQNEELFATFISSIIEDFRNNIVKYSINFYKNK